MDKNDNKNKKMTSIHSFNSNDEVWLAKIHAFLILKLNK